MWLAIMREFFVNIELDLVLTDGSDVLRFVEEVAILLLKLGSALLRFWYFVSARARLAVFLDGQYTITIWFLSIIVFTSFLLQNVSHGLSSRLVEIGCWNVLSVLTMLHHGADSRLVTVIVAEYLRLIWVHVLQVAGARDFLFFSHMIGCESHFLGFRQCHIGHF